MTRAIEIIVGDIAALDVDAIVNAANPTLLGGGGVDGAIHRAAGPGLLEECRRIGGCPHGTARITGGHGLSARFVVHAVGPIWSGGGSGEDDLLGACYVESLRLAVRHEIDSIAFPAISTGAYGFPKDRAAMIAVERVREWTGAQPRRVVFCCFVEDDARRYERLLGGRGTRIV